VDAVPGDPGASVSTLDQDLALGVWMPPPFDKILKSISARLVKNVFADLSREADNVARGRPSLLPYADVNDKEYGVEEGGAAAAAGAGGQQKRAGQ
jgi:hypothetical protein